MIIKVCGITNSVQYQELAALEIEMIGFNFYPKSTRYLSSPLEVSSYLDFNKTQNVGVFVKPSFEQVQSLAKKFELNLIQLHGNESAAFCSEVSQSFKVIKVFGVDDSFDFEMTKPYEESAEYFLFDTKTALYGGSGIKFNWDKLSEYKGSIPFLLSGGIALTDVSEVLNFKHPQFRGIDINSGFETNPGIKNIENISELLKIIKQNEESRR